MSVMVIHHLDDSDRSHLLPVEASVRFGWRRFVGRLDDEAVAALQVQRELTGSVSLELMETPGKATENFQGRRRAQVIQPPPQYSRLGLPPLLLSEPVVVAELFELLGLEDDIHRAPPCQERLTPRVYRLRMLADAAAAHQPAPSSAERAATWGLASADRRSRRRPRRPLPHRLRDVHLDDLAADRQVDEGGEERLPERAREHERVEAELRRVHDDALVALALASGERLVVHQDEPARQLEEQVHLALDEARLAAVAEARPDRPLAAPLRAGEPRVEEGAQRVRRSNEARRRDRADDAVRREQPGGEPLPLSGPAVGREERVDPVAERSHVGPFAQGGAPGERRDGDDAPGVRRLERLRGGV